MIRRSTQTLVRLLPFLLVASACREIDAHGTRGETHSGVVRAVPVLEEAALAKQLFADHCAVCHGAGGCGDGPAATALFPPVRDFSSGRFRLVSTRNGVPSQDDVERTIAHGMPGSAMPAFGWLRPDEVVALAEHVRELAASGMAERLASEDPRLDADAARAEADALMRPGAAFPELPTEGPSSLDAARNDPAAHARGAELFAQSCAMCHGLDGTGMAAPRPNDDGALNWARNLREGYLKGNASADALANRIRAGMPGSAMPGLRLDDQRDLAALVAHVQSLIPPEAYRRRVQDRRRVRARRVDALPTSPGDPSFDTEHEFEVVLAPLWWDERSITAAHVSALHDGDAVAIRVRWRDATGEQRPFSDIERSDGAALQLSCADAPPLFGMGSHDEPNRVWHWKALRLSDAAGAQDLIRPAPHLLGDTRVEAAHPDVPLYRRAEGVPEVSEHVARLAARGVGDTEAVRDAAEVWIEPRWDDGEWSVVFTRALAGGAEDLPCLAPGARVQVALALWNGAAGDSGAHKSISVWQELALDR